MEVVHVRIKFQGLGQHARWRVAHTIQPPFGCAGIHDPYTAFLLITLAIGHDQVDHESLPRQRGTFLVEDADVEAGVDGGEMTQLNHLQAPLFNTTLSMEPGEFMISLFFSIF
ncbi:MAG: hypothetical protein BGO36_08150 [Burkholderiales bacterium 68-10]|nr:MAG: hypothetical protein BGO36_08150 [Burkholderiales bacterium 68-10]